MSPAWIWTFQDPLSKRSHRREPESLIRNTKLKTAHRLTPANMDFEIQQRRRTRQIIPKKNTLSQEVKRSIYMLIFTLLGLIVILSIVFLLNTSQSSQKGYILKQEQLKKEDLLVTNHNLINKIIEAMTYQRIETSPLIKSMLKAEKTVYIQDTGIAK
jgi:flagellar biosynthesis/type III secretory pathway M-ring protein FliF/YscJ